MNYHLLLVRKTFTSRSTIGQIIGTEANNADGKPLCFILEDEARPAGVKIPGFTAIPAGEYKVKITMSNRFKRPLPIIYNNDEDLTIKDGPHVWSGVRIHPGNTDVDTEGCLLPGKTKSKDAVYESSVAFNDILYPFIKNHPAMAAQGYLVLNIVNKQEA